MFVPGTSWSKSLLNWPHRAVMHTPKISSFCRTTETHTFPASLQWNTHASARHSANDKVNGNLVVPAIALNPDSNRKNSCLVLHFSPTVYRSLDANTIVHRPQSLR